MRRHPRSAFVLCAGLAAAAIACSDPASGPPPDAGRPPLVGQRWSDPATWGGALPTASTPVEIAAGTTIILDLPDAVAQSVSIHRDGDLHGTLIVDPEVPLVHLTTGSIEVHGTLQVGWPEAPYTAKAIFTLDGAEVGRGPRLVADDLRGNNEAGGLEGTYRQVGAGDGNLIGLWPLATARAGDYVITFGDSATDPQPFSISGPDGFAASGQVGTLFSDQLVFTAAQGPARFGTGTTRTVSVRVLGAVNDGRGRGVVVHGGRLLIHAAAPAVTRTQLDDHLSPDGTTLTLADPVPWQVGDQVAIGPTDFVGTAAGRTDVVTITAVADRTVTVSPGVPGGRWGKLQYVDVDAAGDAYLSLTAANAPGAPAGVATVFDQRAMVAHLSRPVVIEGVDDEAWRDRGFGVHVMIEDHASVVDVSGLEVRRAGQAGAIGRYPLHLHGLSWAMPDGHGRPAIDQFLGDVPAQVRATTIHQSSQRGLVLHGTSGASAEDVTIVDVRGHGIFTEDGVERDNRFVRPTVLQVRDPEPANMLLHHEVIGQTHAAGSSGIWLANPDNTLQDAWVGDTTNVGVWNSFGSRRPTGLHRDLPMVPRRIPLGVQEGTRAIGNGNRGMMTEHAVAGSFGHTFGASLYSPSVDETETGGPTSFTIRRFHLSKNGSATGGGGYLNRVGFPHYEDATVGDNVGADFAGQTSAPIPGHEAFIRRVLAIDTSLNRATTPAGLAAGAGRHFAKTYHETWFIADALVLGYDGIRPDPGTGNPGRGLFDLADLYIQGVFRFEQFTGIVRPGRPSTGWHRSPNIDGFPLELRGVRRHWSTACAINDPNGLFVTPGRTWVTDHPFLSTGIANPVAVPPAGNGWETTTPFYGLAVHYTVFDTNFFSWNEPITYQRQDPTSGAVIADFAIADGETGSFFGNMRSASVMKGGRYTIRFPGRTATDIVRGSIIDAYRPDDIVLIGVQFDEPAGQVHVGHFDQLGAPPSPEWLGNGHSRALTPVGSLAAVLADTTGTVFFDDRGANLVWFKLKGGLNIHAATQLNAFYRSIGWQILD